MVIYGTRLDLLGQSDGDPEVVAARRMMLADGGIQTLLRELQQWPGKPLVRHNEAGHLLHRLVFLSEVGLKLKTPGSAKSLSAL